MRWGFCKNKNLNENVRISLMISSNSDPAFQVRAIQCDFQSSDEQVYQALRRAVSPLTQSLEKLRRARRIAIKFNQDFMPTWVVMHQAHRQQLVSDPVLRAVLRLLREQTNAELFAIDVGVESLRLGEQRLQGATALPVLREFEVPFIDGHAEPVVWAPVPGGGTLFRYYPIPQTLTEADAVVSVQKLKNHVFAGVTLCLKNLFGLIPIQPKGRPRAYYHHIVRLPYMLADLGQIFNPALNILDGLVCQAGEEWGPGDHPRICNTLIAGDQVVATDACAAYLMGHDPQSDWLTPPFHRDRNALLVAAESGFGTVDLSQIDFQSEVQPPLGEFFAKEIDARQMVVSWQRSTAEQALFYRDHQQEIIQQYAGQYILLQMGEVRWADPSGRISVSRRELAGAHPEQGMWLKYVDPLEAEGEHFEVYEKD
jgi:uncharacterized protein (DUF362 family)